ncbi:MAG: gluconokinase [Chloroflexi bacterium]|nr:gluconokinase [Chloroflexota bacterium]
MKPRFILVTGVAGSGKTSVGKILAKRLGWDFYDADDFHPPENIAKMTAGIPLDDSDRAPWLASLRELIVSSLQADRPAVLACSALKERYRRQLAGEEEEILTVYLKGDFELIRSRLFSRTGHYMKPEMLQSQFEALEEPMNALTVDVSPPVQVIVDGILSAMSQ